ARLRIGRHLRAVRARRDAGEHRQAAARGARAVFEVRGDRGAAVQRRGGDRGEHAARAWGCRGIRDGPDGKTHQGRPDPQRVSRRYSGSDTASQILRLRYHVSDTASQIPRPRYYVSSRASKVQRAYILLRAVTGTPYLGRCTWDEVSATLFRA